MKERGKLFLIGGILFGLLFVFTGEKSLMADDTVAKPWVDMDGDGFNDNAPDEDGDAIPDAADPDFIPAPTVEESNTGMINFGETIQEVGLAEDFSTNLEKFGQRDFLTRAMAQNRCGFDAGDEFGNEGIGIGGSSGGGCVGGVCR
jgi:hypothetical protein